MHSYIFDIGGVLVRYNAEELAQFISDARGVEPDTVKTLLQPDLLYEIETGRMSDIDFYNSYVRNVLPDVSFDDMVNLYEQYFEIRPGFELMLELKGQGAKVYTLSNLAGFHKKAVERKIPGFFEQFDINFLSYEMRLHKPEPDIYKEIIERIGEKPENLIFFDDSPKNVEGAIAAGINGILFSEDRIDEIREQIGHFEQRMG
jgi:putative hydrolase of the HAD superfamily